MFLLSCRLEGEAGREIRKLSRGSGGMGGSRGGGGGSSCKSEIAFKGKTVKPDSSSRPI